MNEFKILSEETFNYKGDKLFLMQLFVKGNYAVELVDSKKSFGRKLTRTKKESELLFDTMIEKLESAKTSEEAALLVKIVFSKKSISEILFLLSITDGMINRKVLMDLKQKIDFKIVARVGYNGVKKETDALTINVYLNLNKKAFGRFIGTTKGDDLIFKKL